MNYERGAVHESIPKVYSQEQVRKVHARTGEKGDGKILVLPLDNAVRIRTGEDGDNAI